MDKVQKKKIVSVTHHCQNLIVLCAGCVKLYAEVSDLFLSFPLPVLFCLLESGIFQGTKKMEVRGH